MKTNMIRQGDVLLVKITEPANINQAAQQPVNRHGLLVLAQGESTLHEHTVSSSDADVLRGDILHVKSDSTTLRTTHIHTGKTLKRHTPQEIGGGYYRIVRQRELSNADLRRAVIVRD